MWSAPNTCWDWSQKLLLATLPCAGHSIQPSSSVAWAIQPWHFQGFGALGPLWSCFQSWKNMRQVWRQPNRLHVQYVWLNFAFFQVGTCWYICCTCRMWHGHPTTVVLVCRASPLVLNSSNTKNSKFWSKNVFQSGIQYKHSPILILAHVCFFLLIPPSSKKHLAPFGIIRKFNIPKLHILSCHHGVPKVP